MLASRRRNFASAYSRESPRSRTSVRTHARVRARTHTCTQTRTRVRRRRHARALEHTSSYARANSRARVFARACARVCLTKLARTYIVHSLLPTPSSHPAHTCFTLCVWPRVQAHAGTRTSVCAQTRAHVHEFTHISSHDQRSQQYKHIANAQISHVHITHTRSEHTSQAHTKLTYTAHTSRAHTTHTHHAHTHIQITHSPDKHKLCTCSVRYSSHVQAHTYTTVCHREQSGSRSH